MSLYLDAKYLEKISSNFEGYQIKRNSPFLAVCRCFICGDSQRSKIKKRGYFFQKEDNILYTCKNCGCGKTSGSCLAIKSILKEHYSHFFQEYLVEQFAANSPAQRIEKQPKFEFIPKFLQQNKPLLQLKKISSLDDDHKAIQFLNNRSIPKEKFKELYYSDNFNSWVNSMIPDKMDERYTEDRIVIPYFNVEGIMTGVNARSLDPNSSKRYIALRFVEGSSTVYNQFGVDLDVRNYIVEGAFDSFFLPNCMAMGSSDFDFDAINKDTSVIVYDNESRNKEINKKIKNTIEKGYKCVIWPSDIKEKDINQMVLAGINVRQVVKQNTYQNQSALLAYNRWNKI